MTPALPDGFTPHPVASTAEAQSLVAQLDGVMDDLLALVEQETEFVRAGRLADSEPLQRGKAELSQQYMAAITRLRASKGVLAQTAPDLLEDLRRRHDLFQARLQINLTVLATAHAVSEGILRGVSDELNRKAVPQTYGASGRANAPVARNAQPLTLSRVL